MSTTVAIGSLLQGANSSSTPLSPPAVLASVVVDFDKSVFLQMALFAVAILLLKPLLFDPMLRLFALREEKTEGARAEARTMQEKAADILRNYEAQVARVRADATVERDSLRRETSRLEADILNEGRSTAEQIVISGDKQIGEEMTKLQAELNDRTQQAATQMVSAILGREIRS